MDFHLHNPDFSISPLQPHHIPALQRLCEQCADYTWIVEGEEVSPSAARDLFEAAPPGRSLDDKLLYGVFDRSGGLVGVLDAFRRYPDDATCPDGAARAWWIGLLMLAPGVRGRGLGREIVEAFAAFVRSQGGASVDLGVVEDNAPAYEFWQRLGFELVRRTEPRPFGKKMQQVSVMRRRINETG